VVEGPDVAVMRSSRLEGLAEDCWPEGAPDLVVEVVSPGDSPGPLQHKVGQYLDAGAELVWLAYPARRTVVAYGKDGSVEILGPEQELTAEAVLPGFCCRVGDLM
jgi:Uma2 family endonuclease